MKIYQVGGSIRDELLGRKSGDKDFLVVGATVEEFRDKFPQAVKIDASFPVFIVNGNHYAFARKDFKVGPGHKGFETVSDPNVSLAEDLHRRDFTINTFVKDIETGLLFYLGTAMEDLKNGVLKHVSNSFQNDPLRVYRAARFASILNFRVHHETIKLMENMKDELSSLPAERVYNELEKSLKYAENPRLFFDVLLDSNTLDIHFPEIRDMTKVVAGLGKHTPDDTAYDHTMKKLNSSKSLIARIMALFHDIGKSATPVDMLPHHYGHDEKGLPIAKQFFERLKVPRYFRKAASLAIAEHMKAHTLDPKYGNMRSGKAVILLNRINKSGYREEFFEFLVADGMPKSLADKLLENTDSILKVNMPEKHKDVRGQRAREIVINMQVQNYKHLIKKE
jgi:tRNA nucleotidyltransferase (CCA-adding enzyme)